MWKDWTLFLDRDGVINHRIPGDYIRRWEDFEFLPKVPEAMVQFSNLFARICIVTNQQGIGKGLMSKADLEQIHAQMRKSLEADGSRIDGIYYCPDLAQANSICRKPAPGMALHAQKEFPEIAFKRSIMVGDSLSDIQFGCRLGMQTVLIETKEEDREKITKAEQEESGFYINYRFASLWEFAKYVVP